MNTFSGLFSCVLAECGGILGGDNQNSGTLKYEDFENNCEWEIVPPSNMTTHLTLTIQHFNLTYMFDTLVIADLDRQVLAKITGEMLYQPRDIKTTGNGASIKLLADNRSQPKSFKIDWKFESGIAPLCAGPRVFSDPDGSLDLSVDSSQLFVGDSVTCLIDFIPVKQDFPLDCASEKPYLHVEIESWVDYGEKANISFYDIYNQNLNFLGGFLREEDDPSFKLDLTYGIQAQYTVMPDPDTAYNVTISYEKFNCDSDQDDTSSWESDSSYWDSDSWSWGSDSSSWGSDSSSWGSTGSSSGRNGRVVVTRVSPLVYIFAAIIACLLVVIGILVYKLKVKNNKPATNLDEYERFIKPSFIQIPSLYPAQSDTF